jgi:hypothetical protein
MEQHFTSRSHKKKESETNQKKNQKKSGGKNAAPLKEDPLSAAAPVAAAPVDEIVSTGEASDEDAPVVKTGLSKKAMKKKNKKRQALVVGDSEEDSDAESDTLLDGDTRAGSIQEPGVASIFLQAVGGDSSSSEDD